MRRMSLFRCLLGVVTFIFTSNLLAAEFNSNWIVNSQQLQALIQQQAKVVYVVKKPGDKPVDVVPGTDARRTIPWMPKNDKDSFAIRVFSDTLTYPGGKKYPKAMPNAEQWTASMQRLGINNGDLVIAVGNREFSARFAKTVAEYGGHAVVYNDAGNDNLLVPFALADKVSGDLVKGDFATSTEDAAPLSLDSTVGLGVDGNNQFWDIRNSAYPHGEKTKSYVYAQGTLAKASNALKFTDLLDESGAWYKSADEVSDILLSHFGDPKAQGNMQHVIVCDSEGLSNIVMWSARSLGYDNVFVLAGGLHEFTMNAENHKYVAVIK